MASISYIILQNKRKQSEQFHTSADLRQVWKYVDESMHFSIGKQPRKEILFRVLVKFVNRCPVLNVPLKVSQNQIAESFEMIDRYTLHPLGARTQTWINRERLFHVRTFGCIVNKGTCNFELKNSHVDFHATTF